MSNTVLSGLDGWSAEQAARWDAWQQANVRSARRGDRLARAAGATILAAAVIVCALLLSGLV